MSDDGFQPFGYRFEILTNKSTETLKAAIRKKWRRWFDTRSGPRGWIVGPFFCLWNSAFDRFGPMVIGRISALDNGSVITGRAGSDLNGTAYLLAVMVVAVPWLGLRAIAGGLSIGTLALLGLLIGSPILVLIVRHHARQDADPLVRFLQGLASSAPAERTKGKTSVEAVAAIRALSLTVDGTEQPGATTIASIEAALEGLGSDGFLILASAPETYMQVAEVSEEFIIEKRNGDRNSHTRAVYADDRPGHGSRDGTSFPLDLTRETLLAYALEKPLPSVLKWVPL